MLLIAYQEDACLARRVRFSRLVPLMALGLLVAALIGAPLLTQSPVEAKGNGQKGKVCLKGGWQILQTSEGSTFSSQQECMSAAAQGAVLVPISPPTQVPPTLVPPTQVPPTQVPPTEVPPTLVPPTEVPPTQVPPTETPTQVPPTGIPTEVPPTEVPPTQVPPTETPVYTPYMSLSFAPMETPPEGIGSWCSFSVTIAGAAPNQTIQITIDRHIDGQIHSYVDSVVIGPDGTGAYTQGASGQDHGILIEATWSGYSTGLQSVACSPPTETPVPPTETPLPTETPVPPTETPVPPTETPFPTQTPSPPTQTPVPDNSPRLTLAFAPMDTPPASTGGWCSFSVTVVNAPADQTIEVVIHRHIGEADYPYPAEVVIGPDGTGLYTGGESGKEFGILVEATWNGYTTGRQLVAC
jgi:hypothetical protein